MEAIGYLIVIVLAIYGIVYIVLPIASVASIITLAVSAVYAFYVSLTSFIQSFKANTDPYATYVDKHTDAIPGVRRNYCFGPGFHQIAEIVKGAFSNLSVYRSNLTAWKNKTKKGLWYFDMWIYIGYGLAIFCSMVLGCFWVAAFSILLATGIIIGMIGFFAFFSVLWLTDRAVLLFKSIHNRCPICKRKSVIPFFVCPTCGLEHKKLVPGPYGVMKRKCSCGTMLATTFLQGRSEYEAHCPFCTTTLFSSSSRQYGIQLVGGIATGKTTFLAAFWHDYKGWLETHKHISYEQTPVEAFDALEDWFNTGYAESTIETNANMYSIIHTVGDDTPVQMTIYDIAGEAFDFANSDIQQQQFRYCEAFLLVIDPTASPDYASDTVTNFINAMDDMSGKQASKSFTVPVAVIITKSDLHKRTLGFPRIKSTFLASDDPALTFEEHQENVCRDFLINHGFDNVLNMIDAKFSNVRFFPVSAMGHNQEDGQYEPWGVLSPVLWLMKHENCPLNSIVSE